MVVTGNKHILKFKIVIFHGIFQTILNIQPCIEMVNTWNITFLPLWYPHDISYSLINWEIKRCYNTGLNITMTLCITFEYIFFSFYIQNYIPSKKKT